MRTLGPVLLSAVATVAMTACDGSTSPQPTKSQPPPVAIAACAASVTVPSDTTRVLPSGAAPPTAVIRTGGALSFDLPHGSTFGFGAPVGAGDAVLCRARGTAAGAVTLVGLQPGFVRVAVETGTGRQRFINVQVTV